MGKTGDITCREMTVKKGTVKSQPLAALLDKPQAQIVCQKPGKTLMPIDEPQVYFVDVVKCINKVCSLLTEMTHLALPDA